MPLLNHLESTDEETTFASIAHEQMHADNSTHRLAQHDFQRIFLEKQKSRYYY